jgi:hypothetical protein
MTNPHEALGIPQTLGRKLPQGVVAWNILVATASLVLGVGYIVQVNMASAKGYDLQTVQRKVDTLKTETTVLQDKVASLSSIQALNDRASQLGFVPVTQIQYVSPVAKSYALAK